METAAIIWPEGKLLPTYDGEWKNVFEYVRGAKISCGRHRVVELFKNMRSTSESATASAANRAVFSM
jgi:hypothetical protein